VLGVVVNIYIHLQFLVSVVPSAMKITDGCSYHVVILYALWNMQAI